MKSTTKTLTEGPLAKQILLVSLPLALSNLLQVLFNMSDVAVVGRFAGSTALGAVGSTSILVTLFTGFLIGLSNGINVLVARFYGARHTADVQKTVHSAAIVSLIAGVALLFIGLLGSPFMLRLLNTKDDLLPGAILYLRVYFLGMPALALYNFGNAVFSSIGDTKKPLIYLSLAGALNIVLNLFFVIVCRLSVVGVALASAISQCVFVPSFYICRGSRAGIQPLGQGHAGAAARRGGDLDLVHEALHDGKAQTRALLGVAGGEHWLHRLRNIRDADAAVRDGNTHNAALIDGRRHCDGADLVRVGVDDAVGHGLGDSGFHIGELGHCGIKLHKKRGQRRAGEALVDGAARKRNFYLIEHLHRCSPPFRRRLCGPGRASAARRAAGSGRSAARPVRLRGVRGPKSGRRPRNP